jgi:tetratricopeptide (TPR) repeat protein
MRLWLKMGLAVTLGIVLAGAAIRAQVKEEVPSSRVDPDWQYTNPGPAKSTEVGNFYLHKGNLKAALSRFQEAIQADPQYAPAHLGLGKVYEKMGHKQKALDAYQHYLDELPSAKQAQQAKDVQSAVERLKRELGK